MYNVIEEVEPFVDEFMPYLEGFEGAVDIVLFKMQLTLALIEAHNAGFEKAESTEEAYKRGMVDGFDAAHVAVNAAMRAKK